jgi:uncharacterized protein (TIGR00730 family)
MTDPRPLIAVFGSSAVREGDDVYRLARDLGHALASAGADVMTGGYSGTMEACSRGAHEAGGHVIGVTVELFEARGPMNPWVIERVHTATLYERLRHLVERASGFVTLPGSIGTLTELFLVWTMLSVAGRTHAPLVVVGEPWPQLLDALRHPHLVVPQLFDHVLVAATPEEAAALALGGRQPRAASRPGDAPVLA